MRKYIYLFFISLIFFSCEKENTNLETFNFDSLTKSKIAVEKNGKLELNVKKENLLNAYKDFNETYGNDVKVKSFKLIEVDSKPYLRFFNEDETVSTIAINKTENGYYVTGTTVCKSKKCASGGGCIPNGEYCTKCRPEGTPPGAPDGDCERTTSSDPVIEQ